MSVNCVRWTIYEEKFPPNLPRRQRRRRWKMVGASFDKWKSITVSWDKRWSMRGRKSRCILCFFFRWSRDYQSGAASSANRSSVYFLRDLRKFREGKKKNQHFKSINLTWQLLSVQLMIFFSFLSGWRFFHLSWWNASDDDTFSWWKILTGGGGGGEGG